MPRHSQDIATDPSLDAQKPLQPASIEADDNLVVDRDHRHGHPSGSRNQLFAGGGVVGDVLRGERDAMRRKELFRRVTRLSGRGPVHGDLLSRHVTLP